jgi:hypothetical protein
MKNKELVRQIQALKTLIGKTQIVSGGDIEVQSHWAKYLCVLVAGFLENALAEVYSDYCRSAANSSVANFATAALGRIQNPKVEMFLRVTKAFNKSWSENIESFLEIDGRKDAINSIMANRHRIAHGKDSNITVARVNEYFVKSLEVIEFMENQCNQT